MRPDFSALRALVETERVRADVPGLALAVVADGDVLLLEGFGTRDLATSQPVTSQTLFPIASDTKAFTAAALCLLAEQGRVDLDAPLREHLPWFELQDSAATASVSARDLLAHRSGLPRHDLVWAGETEHDLESLTRTLARLEPNAPLRSTWQYSNLSYAAAGHLTEVVAGVPWEEVIRQLLLTPLEMTHSHFDACTAAAGDFAFPYRAEGQRQELPDRSSPKPSGGLVSNAPDLARWMLARLGHGGLSPEVLAQLHTPVITTPDATGGVPEREPLGYALGCMVETYRGRPRIYHGGSLIGYSSEICLAPADGVGVAVLTNRDASALPAVLARQVLDLVLGRPALPTVTAPVWSAPAEPDVVRAPRQVQEQLVGRFEHPAYGSLAFSFAGTELVADFHGFGDRLQLQHRADGSWELRFVEVLAVALQLLTDDAGAVFAVTAAMEPSVSPIRFERVP